MKKPRILLSCGKTKAEFYLNATVKSGADATAEYLPKLDTSYDGLILCGGSDIDPEFYGEPIDGAVNIDRDRDDLEFSLLRAYVEAGKPVMGICRGHQLINVFFGGSLYQHLPESPVHTNKSDFFLAHNVSALSDSVVGGLHGESFSVNSSHHQAVKRLGDGLRATAFWEGKYVEAFEHTSLPILGVQWHPERMCYDFERDDTVCGDVFFRYFVDMCTEKDDKK